MPLAARVAILLAIVSPSCSVQPLQPGWIADARTGCKIWDAFLEPNQSVTWSGTCQSGVWQGRGVLQWYQDGEPTERDEGEFRDGMLNGPGVMTLPDGARYEGDFVDGTRTGRGVYTSASGDRKQGLWRNGDLIEGTNTVKIQVSSSNREAPSSTGEIDVPFVKQGGTFTVPILINGVIWLNFTVDSGASDVAIPADVVLVMMRTGTLRESDFLGTQTYRLADGSTVPSKTFRIRTLTVGHRVIENVIGSMSGVQGSLLLGQSFLSRFRSWSIDNQRQVLVLD